MAFVAPLNWSRILMSGAAAGIVGGICFNAFIYLAGLLPAHASVLSLWQFSASTAFGKAAFTSPSYVWIGLVLIFAAAIGWGIGYAYIAHSRPAVNKQPVISGF